MSKIYIFEPTGNKKPTILQCATTQIHGYGSSQECVLSGGKAKGPRKENYLFTKSETVQECCVRHFDISSWMLLLFECSLPWEDVSERQDALSLPPEISHFFYFKQKYSTCYQVDCCNIIRCCKLACTFTHFSSLIGRLRGRSGVQQQAVWSCSQSFTKTSLYIPFQVHGSLRCRIPSMDSCHSWCVTASETSKPAVW